VCDCRKEFPRIELLREHVEGVWVLTEVGDVENCLGVWEVQPGEVGVEPCVGRSEVWDSCAGGNARSSHDDDLLWPAALVPHVIGDGVEGARREGVGRGIGVHHLVGVFLPHLVTFIVFATRALIPRSMRFSMSSTYVVTVVKIL
jgi:hypothetical protein